MNIIEYLNELKTLNPERLIESLKTLKAKASSNELIEIKSLAENISPPWFKNAILSIVINQNEDVPQAPLSGEDNIDYDSTYNIEEIKSEAVAESIGQIIHELDPIIGSLDMAARREVSDFDSSSIKIEIERLLDLIDVFSDWQKAEQTPSFEMISVYELVLAEVDRVRSQSSVDFTLNISQELTASLDKSLTCFIISNALRNAVESSNSITLREKKSILINAGKTDSHFWLSIIDDGIGLQAEQEILFKSRYTTKAGNSGFGLTIVSKAIKSMGGTWGLKNSTPMGAEFYFDIPSKEN